MFDLYYLTKRNILKFLRDKAAVFFSFLSVIILLTLYFLFLGRQYTIDIEGVVDKKTLLFLSTSVIMGGVLIVNTFSLALGSFGVPINDFQSKRLDSLLITPIKQYKIILAYYITSFIITISLTLLMWLITFLYVGIFSGHWYSLLTFIKVTLLLILYTFISTTFLIYIITFIKSVNAFGALSGILGTLIGFISGIYIPLVVLGKTTSYISSLIPFTHMTILLKQVLLKEPYGLLPSEISTTLNEFYGTKEIGVLGYNIGLPYIFIFIILLSVLFLYLAYKNLTRKMK